MTDTNTSNHLVLNLRTQVVTIKADRFWDAVFVPKKFPISETALLVSDVRDLHWCTGAEERCAALAKRIGPVVSAARSNGVQVIHAPTGTMDFYQGSRQRRRLADAPPIDLPDTLDLPIPPPVPIDDSDHACDTNETEPQPVWTRQHPAIDIADEDVVSDDGLEIYGFMASSGLKNLVMMGVHTNGSMLKGSFGIARMTRWGVRCVLVRDLNDAMYNPDRPPYVGHDRGTDLVVEHIERYWCPSVLSTNLLQAHGD